MRKYVLVFLSIIFIAALTACGFLTTSTDTLARPTGIRIEDHTLTWNHNEKAIGFRVRVNNENHSVSENYFPLVLPVGEYELSVQAIGVGGNTSEFSTPIVYTSFGQVSTDGNTQRGLFGAFRDLHTGASFLGHGFNVINSNEFSSRTVLMANPLFNQGDLLRQDLILLNESRSSVNEFSGSSIEELMSSWNASLNVNVSWLSGSVNVRAQYSQSTRQFAEVNFTGVDIVNESLTLILQADLERWRSMMAPGFRNDLLNPNVSPAVLFERYGTHFLRTAVMGGRLTSHFQMAASSRETFHELEAAASVSVRYLTGRTNVDASVNWRNHALQNNVQMSNSLNIIGGAPLGILSDSDIRENFAEWEQSLATRPALMGIRQDSLEEIWNLIDPSEDTVSRFQMPNGTLGTRRDQLQAFFDRFGHDALNELNDFFGLRYVDRLEDIVNIRVNNQEAINGNFEVTAGSTVGITYNFQPENVVSFPANISLSHHAIANNFAEVIDRRIVISDIVPNNTIIEVFLTVGSFNKAIRFLVRGTFTVTFESEHGIFIPPIFGVQAGSLLPRIDDPTHQYLAFDGWFINGNPSLRFNFETTRVESDLLLVAFWINPSAVFYGAGTLVDPWRIYSIYQLRELSEQVNRGNNFAGRFFELQRNLNNVGSFDPIGNNNYESHNSTSTAAINRRFSGHFNGNGYTINGLRINISSTDTYVFAGLFGYLGQGAFIENLILNDVNISATSTAMGGIVFIGAIAAINSGTIRNVEIKSGSLHSNAGASGSAGTSYIGGVAGAMFRGGSSIISSTNHSNINGTARRWTFHGGIVGSSANSRIENGINYGNITGSITNRFTLGFIATFHGGIAGSNAGLIINSHNHGHVAGVIYVGNDMGNNPTDPIKIIGGIVGYMFTQSGVNAASVDGYIFWHNGTPFPVAIINSSNSGMVEQSAIYHRNSNGNWRPIWRTGHIVALTEIRGAQRMLIAGNVAGANHHTGNVEITQFHRVFDNNNETNLPTIISGNIDVSRMTQLAFVGIGGTVTNESSLLIFILSIILGGFLISTEIVLFKRLKECTICYRLF